MRLHCGPVTDSWTHRLKYRTTPKRCEIFGSGRTPFFIFERLDAIDAVEEDCRSGPLPFCKYFGDRRNAPFVLTAISGTQSRLHHFAIILFFRRIPKLLWLQFLLQVVVRLRRIFGTKTVKKFARNCGVVAAVFLASWRYTSAPRSIEARW